MQLRSILKKRYDFKEQSIQDRLASFLGGILSVFLSQSLLWIYIGEHKPPDKLLANLVIGSLFVVIPTLYFSYWGVIRLCEVFFGARLTLKESIQIKRSNIKQAIVNFFNAKPVRYTIATGLFVLIYIYSTLPLVSVEKHWLIMFAFAIFPIYLMREIFLPLGILILLIGAIYLLFIGVSLLPVSVAVVIGAIIIAVAIKK